MIYKHAAVHLGIALLLLSLWAATDAWFLVTGFAAANVLCIVVAAVTGALVTTLVHEWAHFLGARVAGAAYKVPEAFGLFVYEYDFEKNSVSQFNAMSIAGQLGSWASVLMLCWVLPMDTPGRAMLVAGAVTSAIFAGMIELPVLRRTQASRQPLAELSKIDAGVLKRSALVGIGAGLLAWYLAS